MKFSTLALAAAAGLFSIGSSNAATTGIITPHGPHSHPDVDYAIYEMFGSNEAIDDTLKVTALAPGSSKNSLFTSTLSIDMAGGLLLGTAGAPDRIYNGVGAGNAAFDLSIDGEALGGIRSITLQIRFTLPNGYTHGDFFTASLDGVEATGAVIVSSGIGSTGSGQNTRNYGVVAFTWDNLSLQEGDSFAVNVTSPAAGHASIDAIQVDAIPEPSTYALLAAAGAGLMAIKRKRSRA